MTKGAPIPESNRRSPEHEKSLLLINDEVNTFDHVIKSLVEVCGHDEIQAEQCAVLTHFKGGCVVKTGNVETLEKMSLKLKKLNLEAVVV